MFTQLRIDKNNKYWDIMSFILRHATEFVLYYMYVYMYACTVHLLLYLASFAFQKWHQHVGTRHMI